MVGRRTPKIQVNGPFADMTRSEAKARVILKPLHEGAGYPQQPIYTFGVYLEEIFLPAVAPKWKESTRMTTEPRMIHHLVPVFGDCLLQKLLESRCWAS